MVFKAMRDSFFMKMLSFSVFIVVAVILVPFIIFYESLSRFDLIFLPSIIIFCAGLIIWCSMFIKYEFCDEYLYIRGGPVRSKIQYRDITHVKAVNFSAIDLLSGYRVLSARDGIEIYYNKGFGIIKISPENKTLFLLELKKKSPHAYFKE